MNRNQTRSKICRQHVDLVVLAESTPHDCFVERSLDHSSGNLGWVQSTNQGRLPVKGLDTMPEQKVWKSAQKLRMTTWKASSNRPRSCPSHMAGLEQHCPAQESTLWLVA